MKSAAAPLITLLNSATQLAYADLLTITLTGGQVLRYSGADVPLTISGVTWGMGPAFRRSKISSRIGVQVDTLDIEMYADSITPAVLINGVPLIAFVANGGLDNARILLERAFASDWLTAPAGKLRLFSGRVAEIEIDVISAKIKVHSDLELLDVPVPRNVYQPSCLNTFCDNACGLAQATYTSTGVATSASDPTYTSFGASIGSVTGQVPLGVVTFSAGLNAGLSATVKSYAGGVVTLIGPTVNPVSVGDTFSIVFGCEKTQTTCNVTYNNQARFRGQPYIPTPETAS